MLKEYKTKQTYSKTVFGERERETERERERASLDKFLLKS